MLNKRNSVSGLANNPSKLKMAIRAADTHFSYGTAVHFTKVHLDLLGNKKNNNERLYKK